MDLVSAEPQEETNVETQEVSTFVEEPKKTNMVGGRETYTVKTPGGHDVVLYTYITLRQTRAIRAFILESQRVDKDKPIMDEIENMTLEFLVVSYDGSKDNLLERLMDAPKAEADFISKECGMITDPSTRPGAKKDPAEPQA